MAHNFMQLHADTGFLPLGGPFLFSSDRHHSYAGSLRGLQRRLTLKIEYGYGADCKFKSDACLMQPTRGVPAYRSPGVCHGKCGKIFSNLQKVWYTIKNRSHLARAN